MEKSSKPPLHNFSLPCLKWGSQRLLRCTKEDSLYPSCGTSIEDHSSRKSHLSDVFERRTITEGEKSILCALPSDHYLNQSSSVKAATNDDSSGKSPWNLRTRRSACKTPSPLRVLEGSGVNMIHLEIASSQKQSFLDGIKKDMETVNDVSSIKFSVSLTREEIEEDFMEMGRNRPPRRPKKRSRLVQKYMDSVFPGLWLSEITPDSYKVVEIIES